MFNDVSRYSERELGNYFLNLIIGHRIAVTSDLICTVTNVHTYTNYLDLRTYIDYECSDDEGNVAGHYIIRIKPDRGRYDFDGAEWCESEWQEDRAFACDMASVSGFLEGIEVIA